MSDIEGKNTSASETAATKKTVESKKKKAPLKERISKKFREYKSDLKKITWYSREQTFRSSVLVIITIVIFGVCFGGLDLIFFRFLQWLGSLI
mgnify:CR=1 FL=1